MPPMMANGPGVFDVDIPAKPDRPAGDLRIGVAIHQPGERIGLRGRGVVGQDREAVAVGRADVWAAKVLIGLEAVEKDVIGALAVVADGRGEKNSPHPLRCGCTRSACACVRRRSSSHAATPIATLRRAPDDGDMVKPPEFLDSGSRDDWVPDARPRTARIRGPDKAGRGSSAWTGPGHRRCGEGWVWPIVLNSQRRARFGSTPRSERKENLWLPTMWAPE